MSKRTNYNAELGKAIADKIQKIFSNADGITEFYIHVNGSTTTATTIRYNIEEYIIPEEPIKENDNE